MADFLVGVPLVAGLGILRRLLFGQRPLPDKIERIALLQTAAIGDTLLMSAVWHDLREAFPEAQITVFVGESNREMAHLLFGGENVCLLPVKDPWESLRICHGHPVDVVLDYGPWPRWNVLLALAMPARWRAGFRTNGQYRHFCYDVAVFHSGKVHELENHRALASSMGIRTVHSPQIPEQVLNDPVVAPDQEARRVILHLWAGGYKSFHREWPEENWVELAKLLSKAGYEIELFGSPNDRPKSEIMINSMRQAGVIAANRAGELTLAECVQRIRSAHAVISVNTGIMHLAAVAGALTLGLHGPTSAIRWGARGPKAYDISSPCPGCGFLDLGFEYPEEVPPCMAAITVNRVWTEFLLRTSGDKNSEPQI